MPANEEARRALRARTHLCSVCMKPITAQNFIEHYMESIDKNCFIFPSSSTLLCKDSADGLLDMIYYI